MPKAHLRRVQPPALGRIVLYQPYGRRTPVPAIVMATIDTLHPDDVDSGEVPAITRRGRVHLAVVGAATPGLAAVASAEYDVPEDAHARRSTADTFEDYYVEVEQAHGTWRWPNLR